MTPAVQQQYAVQGHTFGARGCSASCSCDPCDCNPFTCGESVSYPLWRVSGYQIATGTIRHQDVSGMVLLSLTQPVKEGTHEEWQEVILVDDKATDEQINALLAVFEDRLHSIPAEVEAFPMTKQAVYRAPLAYTASEAGNVLHVTFSPEHAVLVRGSSAASRAFPRAWTYDGPMALRETFDLRH